MSKFIKVEITGFIDLPDDIDPNDTEAVEELVDNFPVDDLTITNVDDYEVMDTEDN